MLEIIISYLYLLLTLIVIIWRPTIDLILKLIGLKMILILKLIEMIRLNILYDLILLIILKTNSTLYILVIGIIQVHTRHLLNKTVKNYI
jgi:hypothetical protein